VSSSLAALLNNLYVLYQGKSLDLAEKIRFRVIPNAERRNPFCAENSGIFLKLSSQAPELFLHFFPHWRLCQGMTFSTAPRGYTNPGIANNNT
jgi:hypothetical protein